MLKKTVKKVGKTTSKKVDKSQKFILWFDEIGIEDVPLVWGKNASLGEMYRNLVPKWVNIPNWFAVTAYAYRYLLEKTWADKKNAAGETEMRKLILLFRQLNEMRFYQCTHWQP